MQLRDEISHFFGVYERPEGQVDGCHPNEAALDEIESSRRREVELHPDEG